MASRMMSMTSARRFRVRNAPSSDFGEPSAECEVGTVDFRDAVAEGRLSKVVLTFQIGGLIHGYTM